MKLFCFCLLLFFTLSHGAIVSSIPSHLLECYQNGGPNLGAPRRLDVLLSLLKKLELNSQLDMRMFSTSLLRNLRLDGIERANFIETEFVLPYRASAFQFHRYKLLMDIFLPSLNNILDVNQILSTEEKCLLHRMISSTVQQWERGDESVVCPISAQQRQNMETESTKRIHSRCPIEDGVVLTDWGTISPGVLIAAIASSLEDQSVSITDILNTNVFKQDVAEPLLETAKQEWSEDIETFSANNEKQVATADINNVWVATLAGDLAEVVINQGPRVGANPQALVVGSNHRWNDTLLPRHHYLLTQNSTNIDWHITDAEILAGIDGLILAKLLPSWIEQRKSLRLTQLIDMYYSDAGISFNTTVKACNRQVLFHDLFNSEELLTETTRFAHILSLRQITVYIPIEEMERITSAAVTAFVNYVPTVLRQYNRLCRDSNSIPVMDLVVATDAAWKGYDVEQFMSWVGEALELNLQRSSLSLLQGNTGRWIVPPSDNLTAVFSYLSNYTEEWPTRLNIGNVLSSIVEHSLNKTLSETDRKASASPSTVVLMISPSDRPSSNELERAQTLMNTLRTTHFDVYMAYASVDVTEFQNINNEYMDYAEMFLTTPSANVQDIISTVDTFLVKSEIPTRIFGAQCPFNGTVYNQTEYEDFVLPGRKRSYWIHPFYLRHQPLVTVQFRNVGQGRLLACFWRGSESSHNCQSIAEREIHAFNMTTPCSSPEFCLPAYFTVEVLNTTNLCAHNDCRLPQQVGFYLQHSGLSCLPLRNSATIAFTSTLFVVCILSIIIL